MPTVSIPIADPASARAQLQAYLDATIARLQESLGSDARVVVVPQEPRDEGDDGFDAKLKIRPAAGSYWVEVELAWKHGNSHAALEVEPHTKTGTVLLYAAIAMAFVGGYLGDQHYDWLPMLRGIRVGLGILAGLIVGMVLMALLKAVGIGRSKDGDALKARVESVVKAAGALSA